MTPICLICNRPVPDYAPEYCCHGYECGCLGHPTNPCVCSPECSAALMTGIGTPFEDRRIAAGIPLYGPNRTI